MRLPGKAFLGAPDIVSGQLAKEHPRQNVGHSMLQCDEMVALSVHSYSKCCKASFHQNNFCIAILLPSFHRLRISTLDPSVLLLPAWSSSTLPAAVAIPVGSHSATLSLGQFFFFFSKLSSILTFPPGRLSGRFRAFSITSSSVGSPKYTVGTGGDDGGAMDGPEASFTTFSCLLFLFLVPFHQLSSYLSSSSESSG